MKREVEIYIHIPFCVRKCFYCDFLSFPAGEDTKKKYVEMVIKEIEQWEDRGGVYVPSVFIGGGTPSILEGDEIFEIMEAIRRKAVFLEDAEITLEANPGTLSREKLNRYREAGINRLSLGLQSADNRELQALGRIHTWEDFQESFFQARETGFDNLNVDLMSALPGQTENTWERSLQQVRTLEPEHISAYSLIVEEGTPFYEKYGADAARRDAGEESRYLPTEEAERQMYLRTKEILEDGGYRRYEISNYALPGKECRHNCGYWTRKEYRGFGLGASSLIENTRYSVTTEMERYMAGDFSLVSRESLSMREQMEETMFLGLRLSKGVERLGFYRTFGVSMEEVYGEVIRKMKEKGLLLEQEGRVSLTERGMDMSNYVMSEFLLG